MVHAALLQTLAIAIVATDNHVFKSTGSTYTEYSGGRLAKDIAMDRTGKPWTIDSVDGRVYYHNGEAWVVLPYVDAQRIAVDACGTPWTTGSDLKVHMWTGFTWYEVAGALARDISVDGKNRIWLTGTDYLVWYSEGGTFHRYGSVNSAKKIALSADGTPYAIGTDNRVKKGNGSGFTDLGISGIEVAVSSFGTVWVVDSNGDPYFMKGDHWYKHIDGKKAIAIAAA